MESEVLKFESKGKNNTIRVQGGHGINPNVIGVFSDETAGISVSPVEVRCFVKQGILTLGQLQVWLDAEALKEVYEFFSEQFKKREIHWGC